MGNKLILYLFLVLILPSVYAFGITPGQSIIEYSPGKTVDSSFEIINSEHQDLDFVILAQGELNGSISLTDVSVHFGSKDESKRISYQLLTPQKLSPGPHEAEIVALNVPSKNSGSGTFIGSVVGIAHKVRVDVPYPGKYAESSLSITTDGSDILFVFPLISRGQQDIARAKAIIDIYTPLNEKVATLATNEISLLSNSRKEIAAKWDTKEVPSGKYRADATVIYDESTITLLKDFSVGDQFLKIKSVEVNDFSLGGIAKFEFLVENTWNEVIKSAYVQMEVLNKDSVPIADFKSATYDINQFESKVLVAFWDTEGIKKGSYDSRAFLRFGEQSLQHDFKLDVSDNEITVIGVGYVISKSSKGSSNNLTVILITVIAVLVIINLIWFLVLRKRLKPSGR